MLARGESVRILLKFPGSCVPLLASAELSVAARRTEGIAEPALNNRDLL